MAAAAGRQGTSVVVVDDDEDLRHLVGLMLTRAGCEVVAEASDGVEAIAAVGKHQPAFVVMDLMMPVLDGAAATEEITARWPAVQVVGYSAAPGDSLTQAGAVAQFDKKDLGLVIAFIVGPRASGRAIKP